MSRVIKFRAWDQERRLMTKDPKWVEFLMVHPGELEARNYNRAGDIQRLAVMQYTGLKDKNGVEIYESDILCIEECISRGDGGFDDELAVVYWNEPDYGYFVRGQGYYNFLAAIDDHEFKVVGNIHESPELLEGIAMRHATQVDRRHHRPHYRHSHETDRLTAIVTVGFAVGLLLGVTITLGFIDLTGGL